MISRRLFEAACGLMQEAGARISTMDGKPYTVFDRSVLASNGRLHDAVRVPCVFAASVLASLRRHCWQRMVAKVQVDGPSAEQACRSKPACDRCSKQLQAILPDSSLSMQHSLNAVCCIHADSSEDRAGGDTAPQHRR